MYYYDIDLDTVMTGDPLLLTYTFTSLIGQPRKATDSLWRLAPQSLEGMCTGREPCEDSDGEHAFCSGTAWAKALPRPIT